MDLLFWIVVDNLFLTTVKGMSAFNVVLITTIGLAFSIFCYPLTNLIVKKTSNKLCIILGSICNLISILMYTLCNNLVWFIVAASIYNLSSPLRQSAAVMLENNLKEQNRENEYVKWNSYGRLGYSFITMVIALFAGSLFNVWAYLPMVLSIACAVVGLALAIIYSEPKTEVVETANNQSIKSIITSKLMILIFLMNLIAVGLWVFLQTKSTLLIQFVCDDAGIELSTISLIVSGIVFGSRICRLVSNLIFPKIYKKVKNKSKIIIVISILIAISSICFAVGGNINANLYVQLALIAVGLFIIISVRDIYGTLENRIVITNLPENQQKQAIVLSNIYGKCGRLVANAFALLVLGFASLNKVYLYLLIFGLLQIFICIFLSKYLKNENAN
jgi:hypothetical protein